MKTFKPNTMYTFKTLGLIVGVSISIFIFAYGSKNSILTILPLLSLTVTLNYLIFKYNRPTFEFQDHAININGMIIKYDQIKSFHPAKGGSEPYVITTTGDKIDLELSWLKKSDRTEIENTILEKISPLKKEA